MKMDPWDWLKRKFRALQRSGSPLSLILVGTVVFVFLLGWLGSGSEIGVGALGALIYEPSLTWSQPWRLATYALLNFSPWGLLFVVLSLYFFGTILERRWGSERFSWYFLSQVVAFPLVFWLYYILSGSDVELSGMALPACSLLVAWGSLYPSEQVLLWFVLPVRGAWIGWLSGLIPVFSYGWGRPLLGVLIGVPFVLTWAYVTGRYPRIGRMRRGRMFHEGDYEGRDWERLREAEEERRRLRELFERSWGEGDEGTRGTKREE